MGVSKTRAGTEGTAPKQFKAYPKYKDSGVEWLGEIPAHWDVKRLKYQATLNPESLPEDANPDHEMLYVDIGSVDSLGRILEKEELTFSTSPSRARRIVRDGDVIVSTVRTYLRAIAPIQDPEPGTVVSTGFAVIRPNEAFISGFASYALRAPYFVERVVAHSKGVSFPAINESEMATYEIATAPPAEQRSIAAFLDRETARIDALVAKREELIKLLQEKRIALITRAVTKGLDPSVPMKDSGVEWLGEIPAHWEVHPLKRAAERVQTGTTPPTSDAVYYQDGVVAWYGPGSFGNDLPLGAPAKLISQLAVADHVARVFDPGSVAIVTIGATIGKVGFMVRGGSCNQQITVITFNLERVRPKFGAYQLKSFEPILRGIAPNTTLPILDQEEIGSLPFLLPPLPEQRQIADSLDDTIQALDAVIERLRAGMKKIKEFRTALISAAVTGKIDVREEAA